MRVLLFAIGPMLIGFLLDLVLGDPVWLYHPVRAMGAIVSWMEKFLRARFPDDKNGERKAGILLAVICVGLVLAFYNALLTAASWLGIWVWFSAQAFVCYRMIAVCDLRRHSMTVYKKLKEDDIGGAREALSMVVGRDVSRLDEAGMARAAVETVAENTADGVAAPLFYMALGGAGLCAAYKMINTLDSMVGYKNERYLNLGQFPARLDDIAGLLPSRIAALCMILASGLCGLNMKDAARIWSRDRRAHPSPNSAQTESVCAGALGLRLGGDATYGGQIVPKPDIGDDTRPASKEDITAANRLMLATSAVTLLVCCGIRIFALLVW